MEINLVTKDDLQDLDNKLNYLIEIVKGKVENEEPNQWLKTKDVLKLLGCSESSLHNYRSKGIIEYKQVGGTFFYPKDAVDKMLNSNNG